MPRRIQRQRVRGIVRQCQAAGVAVFCKQLGARPVAHLWETGAVDVKYILAWPAEHHIEDGVARFRLRDRHGGDMAEWPEDLRVREFLGARS